MRPEKSGVRFIFVFFIADIAQRYRISKYPTLKLFRNGMMMKREYRGQRSVTAIADFIRQQKVDPIRELQNLEETSTLDVSVSQSQRTAEPGLALVSGHVNFIFPISFRGVNAPSLVTSSRRIQKTIIPMRKWPTSWEMTVFFWQLLGKRTVYLPPLEYLRNVHTHYNNKNIKNVCAMYVCQGKNVFNVVHSTLCWVFWSATI